MSTFDERAAKRSHWQGRLGTLADEHESDVDFSELPLEERFRELWRLSQAGHALSGRPFPTYRRSEMPGRLLSLQDDV